MTFSKNKIIYFWLPVLLWAVIIFLFSSYPTSKASEVHWKDFFVKKTAHVVEFGVLATLTYRALINSGFLKKKAGVFAILFSIFYGATDEIHQSFTPGREPHLRDVIFDTLGSMMAVYFLLYILPNAPKQLRNWAEKLQLTGGKE